MAKYCAATLRYIRPVPRGKAPTITAHGAAGKFVFEKA